MRTIILVLYVVSLGCISACSNSTEPPPTDHRNFQFYGQSYNYDDTPVSISKIGGGGAGDRFILKVQFYKSEKLDHLQMSFYLWSTIDDYGELLSVGEHRGSGENSTLVGVQYNETELRFLNTDPLSYSVVWESITVLERSFSGNGYVLVEEQISYACADSISTSEGKFGPGSPEYEEYYAQSCEPGYYIPMQKLEFVCTDEILWIDEW